MREPNPLANYPLQNQRRLLQLRNAHHPSLGPAASLKPAELSWKTTSTTSLKSKNIFNAGAEDLSWFPLSIGGLLKSGKMPAFRWKRCCAGLTRLSTNTNGVLRKLKR